MAVAVIPEETMVKELIGELIGQKLVNGELLRWLGQRGFTHPEQVKRLEGLFLEAAKELCAPRGDDMYIQAQVEAAREDLTRALRKALDPSERTATDHFPTTVTVWAGADNKHNGPGTLNLKLKEDGRTLILDLWLEKPEKP